MQRDGRGPAPPASKNIQAYPASSLSKNTQAHTPSSSPSLRHQPRLHNPPPSPAAAPLHPFPLHAPSLLHSTPPPCNPRLQARAHTHIQSECVHTKSNTLTSTGEQHVANQPHGHRQVPQRLFEKVAQPGCAQPLVLAHRTLHLTVSLSHVSGRFGVGTRLVSGYEAGEWIRGW